MEWVNGHIERIVHGKDPDIISLPSSQSNILVSALAIHNDRLIVGTMGDGLYVMDLKGNLINKFKQQNNNRNNIIQIKVRDGLIWVATSMV